MSECDNCYHDEKYHGKKGCEYEKDQWISGRNCDGLVAVKCSCSAFTVENFWSGTKFHPTPRPFLHAEDL